MKTKLSTVGVILVITYFVFLTGAHIVIAADANESQPTGTASKPGKYRPLSDSVAEVKILLPDDTTERTIKIHREGQTENIGDIDVYYHRPLFTLVERKSTNGIPDWALPYPWIQKVQTRDTLTYVTAWFRQSDDEFRSVCTKAIIASRKGVSKDRPISVQRWPILHAVVDCQDRLTQKVIASRTTSSLEGSGDNVKIDFELGKEELASFLLALNTESLEFQWSYTYEAVANEGAKSSVEGTIDMSLCAESVLQSEQLDAAKTNGAVPIFENQANQITRNAMMQLSRTIRARRPDLIPQVLDFQQIHDKIFDPKSSWMTMEQLNEQFGKVNDIMNEYLKPLQSISTTDKTTIDEHQDKNTDSIDLKLKSNIPIGKGASISPEISKKSEDIAQHTYGVTFKENTETKKLEPHQFKTYRLQKGLDKITLDSESAVILATDVSGYLKDTPIQTSLLRDLIHFSYPALTDKCELCGGHGLIRCDKCEGRGRYECPKCKGRGLIVSESDEDCSKIVACSVCGGTGTREFPKSENLHAWKFVSERSVVAGGSRSQPVWNYFWTVICNACQGTGRMTIASTRKVEKVAICYNCSGGWIACTNTIRVFLKGTPIDFHCEHGLITCPRCWGKGSTTEFEK